MISFLKTIRFHSAVIKGLNQIFMISGNVLMVGHRCSLYSCTTQLCGLPIPTMEEQDKHVLKVQYLDGIHIEEHDGENFRYAELPIPKFSCSSY